MSLKAYWGMLNEALGIPGITVTMMFQDYLRCSLKKQGKNCQIKDLFMEKYSNQTHTPTHCITIEDAFIEERDVVKCQAMGIQIQPLSLKMNGITMDYLSGNLWI